MKSIAIQHRKIVTSIVLGCTVVATVTAFVLPKQYTSTALVQTRTTKSSSMGSDTATALAAMTGTNAVSPALNYIELMKSRTVLEPIIDDMEWDSPKNKPDTKNFSKSVLNIQNIKGTNLIEVSAKWKTPEGAQKISQSVVDNFLAMQTDKNQQTQSLLVQFLNDRIEEAKDDSDEAAQKFADFSREHQLYSPSDQIKQAIEQTSAYDKMIADLESKQKAAKAQYDVAINKLGEQKTGAKLYNINDNGNVQSIRGQIVSKEVELAGLRQKYTDSHPSIIAVQQQLSQLQENLSDEVSAVVDSNATTLNPAQMELLKNQAIAEATQEAARASEEAIKAKKNDLEKNINDYPDEMVTYLQLKSDSEIKKTIYTNLVQQYEQNKIQEAMESMDIQIIDEANLPEIDKPSGPHKKIIAGAGLAIGMLLAFIYTFVQYKRES